MLFLRDANEGDIALVLSWRNNPLVWEGTYTQRAVISWQEHLNWWGARKDNKSYMIVLLEGSLEREIGIIHISPLSYWSPEIGIIIGEVSLWNKGYGTKTFKMALDLLKVSGYKYTSTTVLDSNTAMIRVLEKLGFKRTCEARDGESRYSLELK